jgi:hypothetical protein
MTQAFFSDRFTPLWLALALVGPAHSQSTPEQQILGACLSLPAADNSVATKEIAVARLGGKYESDIAVLLANGTLQLSYQPARWRSLTNIAAGRVALASFRTPNANRDVLVTTGPGGLVQHHYSLAAGANSTVLDANWANVIDLVVDPSGVLHGLDSSAKCIRRRDLTNGITYPDVTIADGALQLELIEWSGVHEGDELVLRSANHVAIYPLENEAYSLWSAATTGLDDRMVVVRGTSAYPEDLLARTFFVPGSGAFFQCSSASDQDDSFFPCGATPITGLCSGDVVGWPAAGVPDGVNDLLVANSTTGEVFALQRGTVLGDSFGLLMLPELIEEAETFYTFTALGDEGTVFSEALGCGDLDLDGDLDIVFRGSQAGSRYIGWQFDNRILRDSFMPEWSETTYLQAGNEIVANISWFGMATPNATDLQVTAFEHNAANTALLTSPILQNGQASLLVPLGSAAATSLQLSFPSLNLQRVYNVVYRPVRMEFGQIVNAWPSITMLHSPSLDELSTSNWPEVAQANQEVAVDGADGAGTHSGGSQSGGGRGTPPPPLTP